MDYTVRERLKPMDMVVRYTSGSGKQRFHGGSQLKQSQSYPAGPRGLQLNVFSSQGSRISLGYKMFHPSTI